MTHSRIQTCALLVLLSVAGPAAARTWNVPADASTIQAGIDSAQVGDVVALASGTYHETGLQMKAGITLRGAGGGADAVVLDGQYAGPIMTLVNPGAVDPTRIADLTFTQADSGALYCRGIGDLTIENCVFRANRADVYAACAGLTISQTYATILIRDCWFEENSSQISGGALRLGAIDTVEIQRCVFIRNHVEGWGAAVAAGYTLEPGVVLDQCTFVGNTGSSPGSGVLKIGWGNLEMRRSIMAFNDLVEVTSGPDHLGMAAAYCSDLYANWQPGSAFATRGGDEPNFQADPCFCDVDSDDLHLAADSWCLPGVGPVVCEELVGALGEGCAAMACQETPVAERSWSTVRSLFD